MLIILSLICVIVALLYYYLIANDDFWKNKNVVFRKPALVFGNIRERVYQKIALHDFMQQYYEEYHKTVPYVGKFITIINKFTLLGEFFEKIY